MKRMFFAIACVLTVSIVLLSAGKKDKSMTKEKGVYVVNTTVIAKDVMGYEGPTPLKVFIKGNKVQKIEALPNNETPRYWNAAWTHLQKAWDGKSVKAAKTMKVDGRTGATYSSDAIKDNVKRALEYYEKNK